MTYIDLNAAQFHQSLIRADQSDSRQSAALNFNVLTVYKECSNSVTLKLSNKLSEKLKNYNLIEYIDLTNLLTELLNLFYKPVSDFNGSKVHTEGKIHCL